MSPQAKRVRNALREVGIKAKVRTETKVKSERGLKYREYGEASSHPFRASSVDLAALAKSSQCTVYVVEPYAWLSSQYSENGRVVRIS